MKQLILLILAVCLSLYGCKKEDLNISLCNPEKYFPLEIGNYWVFNNYTRYDNGLVERFENDSLHVSGDSLMLGYRFFHVEGNFYQRPYSQWLTYDQGQVRSSDNYIYFDCPRMIDSKKLYPIAHFDYPATINTVRKDTLISVPAGDFDPVMLFEGHSMVEDTIWVVTYKFYYARNVGLVKFSARAIGHEFEKNLELIRYHIQ
jgi:hypothetical protein